MHYKLYCLDRRDKITRAHVIEAESDEAAMERARALDLSSECELWVGTRRVGRMVFSAVAHG